MLREYQERAIEAIGRSMAKHRRTVFVLPTGGGKTFLTANIIKRRIEKSDQKVLVLVHRKELILQWAKTLKDKFGIFSGVIKAGFTPTPSLRVQIASIQTLVRRNMPENVGLIIIDEAHHVNAASYLKVLDNYPDAYVLGVTATPIRTDGKGLGDVFKHMVQGPSTMELMDMGFLVPTKIFTNPINMSMLQMIVRGGDYTQKSLHELGEMLSSEEITADLHKMWAGKAQGLRTIAFAPSVDSSKQVVEIFKSNGVSAAHVDGMTPDWERDQIFRDLASGKVIYVSNVGVVTEGFDCPDVECIQLFRPTKSYALYKQMVGRGLRSAPGKKYCILLDHANNVYEHGPPSVDMDWSLAKSKVKKESEDTLLAVQEVNEDGQTELDFVFKSDLLLMDKQLELVEVDTRFRRELIDECFQYAADKGWKKSSAYFNFRKGMIKRGDSPTITELHYFKKQLKYDPFWVKAQARELGIKMLSK